MTHPLIQAGQFDQAASWTVTVGIWPCLKPQGTHASRALFGLLFVALLCGCNQTQVFSVASEDSPEAKVTLLKQ